MHERKIKFIIAVCLAALNTTTSTPQMLHEFSLGSLPKHIPQCYAYLKLAERAHMTVRLVNSSSSKAENSRYSVMACWAPVCDRPTTSLLLDQSCRGIVEYRQPRAGLGHHGSFPNSHSNAQSGLPHNHLTSITMAILRTSAAVTIAGAALLTAVPAQTMVGTWTETTVTDADVNLLDQSAGNASYYAPDVTTAICFIAMEGLWTQTVAGTNYKYQIAGCAVNDASGLDPCVDRECAESDFDVVIFSQSWTNTVQVTSVTQHS